MPTNASKVKDGLIDVVPPGRMVIPRVGQKNKYMAIHFKAKIPKKVAKLLPPSALVLGPDQLQVEQINLQGLSPKAQAIAITALGLMLLG